MLTVVASLKGGSGKSTLTFNLAIWLALAGERVKTFDLDPQATLSDVLEVRQEEAYEPQVEGVTGLRGMKAAAHDDALMGLVDVGTADLASMKKAMAMAERILIPVTPSQADIWSTQRFVTMVDECCDANRPRVQAFINRGDTHRAVRETDEAAAALVALRGVEFVRPRLHQRTVYRRSFSEGLGVFELEPRGKASREFVALAASLFPEVLQ